MKSELLRKALMATYGDGGKVKGKVAPKGDEPTLVKSKSDLPPGGVWETDESGKQFYVVRTKGDTPKKHIPADGKPKSSVKKGTGKYTPPQPTDIPPSDWKAEKKFYLEEEKIKEPEVDPFELAFGYRGNKKEITNEAEAASMPKIRLANGKMANVREWQVEGKYNDKTKSWQTEDAIGGTKLYGYYDENNKLVPMDESKTNYSTDAKGAPYYDPAKIVSPASYTANLINKGAVKPTDSEQTLKVSQANEEQRMNYLKSGEVAPQVKVTETISPTNFNATGYSVGKETDIQKVKNQYVPTTGLNMPMPILTDDKMSRTTAKFKKGGLVGKYANGTPPYGVKINPYIKYNDSSIYNDISANTITDPNAPTLDALAKSQDTDLNFMGGTKVKNMTGAEKQGISQLATIGGTAVSGAVNAMDKKDGRSSYYGQYVSGGVSGGSKGLALGMNPALMAATGGLSAPIGAAVGFAAGAAKGVIGVDKEKKALAAATSGEIRDNAANSLTYDPNAPDTFKASNYNEGDSKTLGKGGLKYEFGQKLKGKFAKGGTIEGKGTSTSDSIETKVGGKGIPEGSFITPAKNNGLAKLIRKDILGDNPNKVAGFKKGGNADMAVSNGEHLFTPKEKAKITAYLGQEILEKLAPEAEEGEDKACGGIAKKYADGGGVKGNTTKRMYSTGNPSLDAEIDVLYKTGNWRREAIDAIEKKAKSLGIDTGESFLNPSSRSGVFKDLKTKSDYFTKEVNKSVRNADEQKINKAKRFVLAPTAPNGMNDEDFMTYRKLKKEVISEGKDMAPLNQFVSAKEKELESKNDATQTFNRQIETGKDYAKKYQLAQDLKARLEYAKKNTDKFTADELEKLNSEAKKSSLEYDKLKTPSQYANPNNKRLDVIYEEFAKKRYKPTKVEERQSAPVIQQNAVVAQQAPVVKEEVKVTEPIAQPVAAVTNPTVAPVIKPSAVAPKLKNALVAKKAVTSKNNAVQIVDVEGANW